MSEVDYGKILSDALSGNGLRKDLREEASARIAMALLYRECALAVEAASKQGFPLALLSDEDQEAFRFGLRADHYGCRVWFERTNLREITVQYVGFPSSVIATIGVAEILVPADLDAQVLHETLQGLVKQAIKRLALVVTLRED